MADDTTRGRAYHTEGKPIEIERAEALIIEAQHAAQAAQRKPLQ